MNIVEQMLWIVSNQDIKFLEDMVNFMLRNTFFLRM